MEGFTPFSAVLGGTLIGLWASLMWMASGRIADIVGDVLAPVRGDCGVARDVSGQPGRDRHLSTFGDRS